MTIIILIGQSIRIVASRAIIMLIDRWRMVVGSRIRERLGEVGLSQSELARRVGLSQPAVNALIRGATRSTPQLHLIARELRTSPAFLNGEVDDPALDAPEQPELSQSEAALVAVFRDLDDRTRAALLLVAQTMAKGIVQAADGTHLLQSRQPEEL